jgi:hypothetical protein
MVSDPHISPGKIQPQLFPLIQRVIQRDALSQYARVLQSIFEVYTFCGPRVAVMSDFEVLYHSVIERSLGVCELGVLWCCPSKCKWYQIV